MISYYVVYYIEHLFDINVLEDLGLNIQSTLLACGIYGYFNKPKIIYP